MTPSNVYFQNNVVILFKDDQRLLSPMITAEQPRQREKGEDIDETNYIVSILGKVLACFCLSLVFYL